MFITYTRSDVELAKIRLLFYMQLKWNETEMFKDQKGPKKHHTIIIQVVNTTFWLYCKFEALR